MGGRRFRIVEQRVERSIAASVQAKKHSVPTAVGGGSLHMPSSFDGIGLGAGAGGASNIPSRRAQEAPMRISTF